MLAEQLAGLRVYSDPLYFCGSIAPMFDISALLLLVCNRAFYQQNTFS
jgi:hypothetical protein